MQDHRCDTTLHDGMLPRNTPKAITFHLAAKRRTGIILLGGAEGVHV